MSVTVETVAKKLNVSQDELIKKSLKTYLNEQLRFINAERLDLCKKFGASSLKEMDELITKGGAKEEDILEDFQRVDYLTAEAKKIEKMLKEI
ncbi:MAG: hypothetical protein ACE5OR_04205 [bacterium]